MPDPLAGGRALSREKIHRSMTVKQNRFCDLFAGNPLAPTFGHTYRCSKVLKLNPNTCSNWLLRNEAVRARIKELLAEREEDVEQIRHILQGAGMQAINRLLESLEHLEGFKLYDARTYLAEQQSCEPGDVKLPKHGTVEWSRIETTVTRHNKNQITLLKVVLDQAQLTIAHSVGHPATRIEGEIRHKRDDDSELAKRIRALPPMEALKLRGAIDEAISLLQRGGTLERNGDDPEPVDADTGGAHRALPPATVDTPT